MIVVTYTIVGMEESVLKEFDVEVGLMSSVKAQYMKGRGGSVLISIWADDFCIAFSVGVLLGKKMAKSSIINTL